MGALKFMLLLCGVSFCLASHHSHQIIPVEGYESELQDLGEHTETHDTPVKVIKITKTVAVKVPVPYPVKVVQKVPYPVHVAKPYPVPVPQIVKIPQPLLSTSHHEQQRLDGGHQSSDGNSYDVHENNEAQNQGGYEPSDENESYGGGDYSNYQNAHFGNEYAQDSPAQSYGAPNTFYGSPSGHGGSSFESNSYDEAIQKYLDGHQQNRQNEGHHY